MNFLSSLRVEAKCLHPPKLKIFSLSVSELHMFLSGNSVRTSTLFTLLEILKQSIRARFILVFSHYVRIPVGKEFTQTPSLDCLVKQPGRFQKFM